VTKLLAQAIDAVLERGVLARRQSASARPVSQAIELIGLVTKPLRFAARDGAAVAGYLDAMLDLVDLALDAGAMAISVIAPTILSSAIVSAPVIATLILGRSGCRGEDRSREKGRKQDFAHRLLPC
jgi:hypothetical protein